MKIGSVMAGEKPGNFVILMNGNPVGIFLSLEKDPVLVVSSCVELAGILVYTYYWTRIFINEYHFLVTLSPPLMYVVVISLPGRAYHHLERLKRLVGKEDDRSSVSSAN